MTNQDAERVVKIIRRYADELPEPCRVRKAKKGTTFGYVVEYGSVTILTTQAARAFIQQHFPEAVRAFMGATSAGGHD